MIGLDVSRNIMEDMSSLEHFSEEEFVIVDDISSGKYHFEPYSSNRLIYLAEMDLIYSINDLEKGLLIRAPRKIDETHCSNWLVRDITYIIPQLEKLLRNIGITKSNAPEKIKERDGCCCQLCGEKDFRTLQVHHIVPRKNPIILESFIHSPVNQITLCANCHRIEHYISRHGNENERKNHVKRLFEFTGFNWDDRLSSAYYASTEDIAFLNSMWK